jgi:hypothetical protein
MSRHLAAVWYRGNLSESGPGLSNLPGLQAPPLKKRLCASGARAFGNVAHAAPRSRIPSYGLVMTARSRVPEAGAMAEHR